MTGEDFFIKFILLCGLCTRVVRKSISFFYFFFLYLDYYKGKVFYRHLEMLKASVHYVCESLMA